MEGLTIITAAGLCAAAVSFTITWTSIFRPVRDLIERKSEKLGELIHCPWCFSHYVVFVMLFFTKQRIMFSGAIIFDYFVTAFYMIAICGLVHYVLLRAYEPVINMMMTRKIEKLKKQEHGQE